MGQNTETDSALISKLLAVLRREYDRRDLYISKIKKAGIFLLKVCLAIIVIITELAKYSIYNKKIRYTLLTTAAIILFCILTPKMCSDEIEAKITHQRRHASSINSRISNSLSDSQECRTFDLTIEKFMQKWELTGGTFALMRNDSLIYAKGYGYADKEREIGCDASNTFRIASASKLLTATAVAKLIEEKKLSLNSKVFGSEGILNDSIFLNLKDHNLKKITIEHLMRHTAGFSTPIKDPAFAGYSVAKSLGKKLPLTVDDMVVYSTQHKLNAQPGQRYHYSNLGYIILGKVIEVTTGMSYEEYLQQEILAPAGCYDIYIANNYSKDRGENEVKYYEVKEAEKFDAFDGSSKRVLKSNGGNNVTLLSSAGGWVASAPELLRFVASINGSGVKRDILSSESVKMMTYDSSDRRKKPMGWATVKGREWTRSGSMAGTCALIKQQKNGYTWVFITNSSAWISYHLSDHISSNITRAISKVKRWPTQDLFTVAGEESITTR